MQRRVSKAMEEQEEERGEGRGTKGGSVEVGG